MMSSGDVNNYIYHLIKQRCHILTSDISDTYTCTCESGWTNSGATTEPCVTRVCGGGLTCQNGGTCIPADAPTPAHCDCVPGYIGDNCESTSSPHVLFCSFGQFVDTLKLSRVLLMIDYNSEAACAARSRRKSRCEDNKIKSSPDATELNSSTSASAFG